MVMVTPDPSTCGRRCRCGITKSTTQDHDEGGGVLVDRRDVARGQRLDQAEEEAADERPDRVAHAAEHRGGEALERQRDADVVAGVGDRRDEDPGERADRGGEREGERHHPVGVDADELRREAVVRGGEHGAAGQRPGEEDPEADEDGERARRAPRAPAAGWWRPGSGSGCRRRRPGSGGAACRRRAARRRG